jgi:peptide/nickel transport system substrate-binding protein
MPRTRLLIHLAALAALLLAACGPSAQPAPAKPAEGQPAATTAPAKPAEAKPAESKPAAQPAATAAPAAKPAESKPAAGTADTEAKIVASQATDADTLHPILISSTNSEMIARLIMEGLYETDPTTTKPVPLIAESFSNPDPKTWEFKLRKGVKFHNGEPVTVQDVAYSYEVAVADPKTRLTVAKANIEGTEIVDDSTIRVKTKTIYPAFLDNLASDVRIIPANYAKQVGTDGFNLKPIGSGPYKFVEWVKDDHLTLVRNDDYWGEKPKIKEIVWKPIPDAATRVAALETGQSDVIVHLPPTEAQRLEGHKELTVTKVPSMRTIYIGMNTGTGKAEAVDEPLKNVKVRHAIQRAIDYDAIIRDVLKGDGIRVASTLVSANWAFDKDLKPVEYNPEEAKRLLAEAGYPDGITVDFDVPSGRYLLDREVGEAVAGQLAKVGIKTNLMIQEWGAFYDKYLGLKDKGIYLLGVGKNIYADDHFFTYYHSKGRGFYFSDQEVDGLIDKALSTLDENVRMDAFKQLQRVLIDKAHWAYLYQQMDIYGVRNRLQFEPTPDEWMHLEKSQVNK